MNKEPNCPVHTTLAVIGGKWKPIILWYLQDRTKRFNELNREIDGITQKMLAQELKQMEKEGLVLRKAYPEIPPRVEYSITEYGKTLNPLIKSMNDWGSKHENRGVSNE